MRRYKSKIRDQIDIDAWNIQLQANAWISIQVKNQVWGLVTNLAKFSERPHERSAMRATEINLVRNQIKDQIWDQVSNEEQ